MSETNAELIKKARVASTGYLGHDYLLEDMANALEKAESERRTALAVIGMIRARALDRISADDGDHGVSAFLLDGMTR